MKNPNTHNTLHIKNMVCPRCIMAVTAILSRLDIKARHVELGLVELERPLDMETENALRTALNEMGFELLDNRQDRLLEQIRNAIIELVHYTDTAQKIKLSDFLASRLNRDYSSLSKLFSEVNGMSIERFYIEQKIELVKELLAYGELTVSEIAIQLQYSSVAHLSSQFRSVTGMTTRQFKQQIHPKRRSIDQI